MDKSNSNEKVDDGKKSSAAEHPPEVVRDAVKKVQAVAGRILEHAGKEVEEAGLAVGEAGERLMEVGRKLKSDETTKSS